MNTTKTAEKQGGNRREFERVIPERDAPVRVNINGDGFIEVTNAVDISEGGIRIVVKHRFAGCAVDQPAQFIIHLPKPVNKHFSFKGRIKHVLDDSFGVQFSGLSPTDLALVRRYIATRSNRAPRGGFLPESLRALLGL
ncbi:MAG: PilZ domain-containing protein [Burkholderiales bacterium]|nr:PilZ domain-containing protein [Burkholderiales bacterium]